MIDKAKSKGIHLTIQKLKKLVDSNDKKRFVLSGDLSKIRANQDHSVNVDLDLLELKPPAILYHGTTQRNLESIKAEGLLKGKRHHVHLSIDPATFVKVGMRYGKPVVLEINACRCFRRDINFFVQRMESGLQILCPQNILSEEHINIVESEVLEN